MSKPTSSSGQPGTSTAAAAPPAIERMAFKPPPNMPTDPKLWFTLLEINFRAAGITSEETKFQHLASAMDARHAVEVKDLLTTPDPDLPYTQVKTTLLRRLNVSQETQTRKLLEEQTLGDRKPSQFLRYMQDLAGGGVDEAFLRTLWMGRLPTTVQQILAAHTRLGLDDTAEIADSIMDVVRQPQVPTLAAVSPPSNSGTYSCNCNRRQPRHRQRPRSHSRRRVTPKRDASTSGMCWNHQTFGKEARKCKKPCTYTGNSVGNR